MLIDLIQELKEIAIVNTNIKENIRQKLKTQGFLFLTMDEMNEINNENFGREFEQVFSHFKSSETNYLTACARLETLCQKIIEDLFIEKYSALQHELAESIVGDNKLLNDIKRICQEAPTFNNMRILNRILDAAHATLENPENAETIKHFNKVHAALDGKIPWQHRIATGISILLGIVFVAAAAVCVALCFSITPAFIIPAGVLLVLGVRMFASARSSWQNEVQWHHHHAHPKAMQATLFYRQLLQKAESPVLPLAPHGGGVSPGIRQKQD